MTILITGADGFVGSALCDRVRNEALPCSGVVRRLKSVLDGTQNVVIGDISAETDWSSAVKGVTQIVHLAACVHLMNNSSPVAQAEYRRTNVQGTLNLARQGVAAGVRRFVFISSVKVNGESTEVGHCFTEDDMPAPKDPYGISKMEAEQGLRQLASETGLEVVIIRPPLVYGPGAKGNFATLLRAVRGGWPLPLGAVHNQRSLVALHNLVDFIIVCTTHPHASNQTFMVSDGHDISTTELVRGLARAAAVPARLLPVPIWVLKGVGTLMGKSEAVLRLCGNLQVDVSKARRLLGWVPPVSVDEGLRRALADGRDK